MFHKTLVDASLTPSTYPVPGYRALQDPPTVDLVQAMRLSSYLERLLPSIINEEQVTAGRADLFINFHIP